MDAFKVAHIATEIAVIGAVYVVLKRKVDHERAERELLAAKVQKLEETVKQQMEALKILYARTENTKPQKQQQKKKTRGAGVFQSDAEDEREKEEVTVSSEYQALEDEDEYERPEHVIGSSSLDETD
ncbi:conserved hypothetical protein [Lausannevirus]|uniref:Uncharacterized protein n=1 Tax=Lausannevirus TaxID=999883 RepID=F2WLQ4_9VIRU|nr:hypothetical protein LAU_0326 [Lausannevirus]AEA07177.1 conserved hypothetical protein [Lausannevirus]